MSAYTHWLLATDDPMVIRHRNEVLAFAPNPRERPAERPVVVTADRARPGDTDPRPAPPSPKRWAMVEPDPTAVQAYLSGSTPELPSRSVGPAVQSARTALERLAYEMAMLAERQGLGR